MIGALRAETRAYDAIERLTRRRGWLVALALVAAALSIFTATPEYHGVEGLDSWKAILLQARDPFVQHPYGVGTHESKLAFRLLVPLVGGRLGLDVWGYLALQAAAGVVLLGAFARLCWDTTADRVTTVLATLALGLCWAGATAFVEVRGTFDSVALSLLTLAALFRNPLLIAACVTLAGFTDERALAAALLVALFQAIRPATASPRLRVGGVVAGIALYAIGRLVLIELTDLSIDGNGITPLAFWELGPAAAWAGLEGLWIAPFVAVAVLVARRRYLLAAALVAGTAVILGIAVSVSDVTRSMAYALPAVFVGLAALAGTASAHLRRAALAAVFASLLWPLYYIDGNTTIRLSLPLPVRILIPPEAAQTPTPPPGGFPVESKQP